MQFVFFTLIPAYLFIALDLHHEFASLFHSHMYKAAFSQGHNSISIPEKLQVFIGPEYGDRYYNTYHPILFLFIKDLERDKLKIIHSMQHMMCEKKQLDIKCTVMI